jgi:hypothetical protein
MQYDDERHTAGRGHILEEIFERLYPARRSPEPDQEKVVVRSPISALFSPGAF